MKNLFKSFVVGALLLGSVGCSDMFKEDLYEINNEIDKINQRIDSLCNAVNTNIASLQTIIDVMQDNDYVDSITPIVEGGETVGYEIVFTQSGSVKIYHGKKGETGATGHTPVIGVKQAEDGRWYWTVDGAYLLDGEGDKILAEAIDGEDGATGADGITPQLKVEGDYWYISYDNKATWERLGKATGEAGKDGDSMFQSVNYNDEYVELVLIDGTVLRIPTWASHMLLVDEIAKINSNISAIQAAIEALESNDYVQKVTPVKDEDGNVIGYTLQFAFTGDVTIYHGEDGKDGEDGEDGKDGADGEDGKDGYTPVIGARQHPDGNWYWTVDTEWLLDTNGNKVKTTGEDGTSGITPELKIQDDYWYVSYDKGQTWTKLGKAKGEDGAAGSAGTAGDAFFKGVDTSDEYYVKFTLADGTVIKIPTWKAYQELADLVDQLNTNFKSLNDIVVGIQNNDYITGYTPIVDPQTNEEIGYTLHFAKSGDITIYHGKTGQDGVAPDISIQEHPKYGLCWTYNGEFIIDPGTGKPVALPSDGKNGKDGVSPKLKIEDGEWWVSYNNGSSWTSLGQATGDTGATGGTGDSFFKSIEPEYAKDANGNVLKDELGRPIVAYIVMTLAGENEGDEVTYKVPTEYVTSELNKRIAALETQFTAIETIVKAIQNAEYIKSVVEQYDGPALVGYKITFIKYTIENGTLIPSERDVYIGSASNAGSKVEYAKDENGDYYWVIDGSPLKDEDGNILYIEGKTPTVEINKDGYWVINGVNTGVKAEGKDGANGSNGSNASSLFSDVVLDGSYYVFTFTDGRDPIKVPSWKAFEDLQKAVTQLTATVESFTELIQGNKYIEKVEALSENKGYTLFVKEFNADTQTWDTKSYTIYNGTDGSNGTTPVVPTISVAQDPENPEDQNYYWKVGDNWLTDAQGNKIRANALDGDPGLDALTPEFRIVNGTLYYKYTNEGDDKWRELANVQGSSAAVNIIFQNPANPLESEWIEIRFGEGENDKIKIPTWVAYEKIQDTISSLTTNVEAISALVYGHKYVESFKELENGGYEFVVRYYDEAAKEWKTEVHTIDITTADEIGVKQDTDGNYYWTKGGEWLLDAAGNKVMVDGSAERTLEFKSENDGKLYYKYSDETEWTVLDIAVSESVVESNVVVKEENGKVTVTVLDDKGMILYTFSAPSWEAFEALQGRVIALEEQVTDIYTLIAQLTTNYEALSGDVKTMKDKLAKCKFIGEYEYDAERKGNVIYLVDIDGNKLQNAAGEYETIFIADGEDGEDFDASMLSFKEVDGDYFWTYNGEMLLDAEGNPVKAHGADGIDGRTPEFRIFNDVLQYRYEGEGDDAWQSLGNVKGSASAANITVENPADPDHSMWIMIQYTYTDAQGNEIVEEVKLPTYYAYEKALDEIAAIKSTIDMVETFLKGNKFVSDYELTYDNNGMVSGCTVTTVEYKLQEDGSYRVFTSEAEFNPSQTMSVKLENDVWYLVFYNEKGEEVKRPLSQSTFTFVPKVAVNNGYLYVAKVSEPGNDYTDTTKWDCLGAVVELLGGETQGALKSVEEVDGYICFTFSNGEVLKVPSEAKFQEVLDRLDAVEGTVAGLQPLLDGQTFITGITEKADGSGFDYTYKTVDSEGNVSENKTGSVTFDGLVTPNATGDGFTVSGYEGELSWKLDPKFEIHEGVLQMSIDGGKTWVDVPALADSNNYGRIVSVTETVDGVDVVVAYEIYFPDPTDLTKEVGPYKVLSWAGYELLADRVDALESTVAGLQPLLDGNTFITGITPNTDGSGFSYTYKTVGTNGSLSEEQTGSVTFDGLVTPNATGDGFTVSGYEGELSWKLDPKFEIHEGVLQMSIDGGKTWVDVPALADSNNYGRIVSVTETVDGVDVVVAYEIYFPDPTDLTKEVGPYKVLSWAGYELLADRVDALESTVAGLQPLLDGNTFITGITPNTDGSGFSYTYKTVGTNGSLSEEQTGSVTFDGLVTPNATGDGFTVSGYEGELSWKLDPKFEIIEGVLKMSIDGGKNWIDVPALSDNNTFGYTKEIKNADEVVIGYEIYFPDPTDPSKYVGPYEVLSMAGYELLVGRVKALEGTVAGLQPLLDGNTFITGITPNTDGSGFSYTYKTVGTNGSLSEEKTGSVLLTGIVVPNDNGGYNVFTGYDKDGKPVYVELSTNQTPVFGMYNGTVYMSVDKGADATKIEAQIENTKDGINWIEVFKVADVDTNTVGTYTPIEDNGVVVGYKISFPNPSDPEKPIEYEVAKFITTPQIEFSTDGTTITDLNIGGESSMDVTCTITGSFPDDDNHPKIYAACEGHFTSSIESLKRDSNTQYTVVITVKPTTAYDSELNGKLTVYCPYYGNTGIGQLNLKAQGAGIEIKSVEKSGNDTQATITVDGIVEDNGEELRVKAIGSSSPSWVSMGSVRNPSNSKIEQTLNLTPYVIGSKEDSENNYDRTSRTCTLAVVTPSGRETGYVQINQAPIINLADQGSANCYIISAPGRYMIPAREGNSSTPLWTGTTPPSNLKLTLVNSDVSGGQVNLLSEQSATIFNYKEKDYIVFEVPNEITAGNTIVSLKSGNEILWSWHLWFCTNKITDHKYPEEDGTFENKYVMDRPLGATDGINIDLSLLSALGGSNKYYVWSDGTYYQWGRKDPFLVNEDGALVGSEVASSGTYNSSTDKLIYNSNWTSTDGWGATKSKNDPCPPGYKVPSYNIWRENNSDEAGISISSVNISTTTYEAYTYNLTDPTNESGTLPDTYIFYGYNGYLKTDGKLYKKEPTTIDVTIPGPIEATNLTNPRRGRVRLTNVQLEVSAELYYGGLWSNSSSINLLYGYAGLDFSDFNSTSIQDQVTFKECMVSEGSGIFSVKWGDPYKITSLTDLEKVAVFGKVVLSGSANKYVYDYDYSKNSPANGFQVRCVKE